MDDAAFQRIDREHERIKGALDEFLRAGDGAAQLTLHALLQAFLDFCVEHVEPHMSFEERELFPSLEVYLSDGSVETLRRDHETVRQLIASLQTAALRARATDTSDSAALASDGRDLVLLLLDHLRREDDVVIPLFRKLLEEGTDA